MKRGEGLRLTTWLKLERPLRAGRVMTRSTRSTRSLRSRPRTARGRGFRSRGFPLLWALLVAPQLLLPAGTVICFETCGEWEITSEHASHSCNHFEETLSTGCCGGGHAGDLTDHESPNSAHDHGAHDHSAHHDHHDHEHAHVSDDANAGTAGSSCLDFRPGDESTAAKLISSQVTALPTSPSSFETTLPPEIGVARFSILRDRPPQLLFGDCYHSPLRV